MQKTFHNILLGISVLPALLVLPALAEEITERQVLNEDTVLDGVSATNIENSSVGGVILSNHKLVIKDSDFSGNSSGAAAVLYDNSLIAYKNGGTYSVSIDNSQISDNSAADFGAVAIFSPGSSVSNSIFSNNQATADYDNLGDGAGALFLGSESQTVISKSTFSDNSSGTIGGAIATRPINYWLETNYSGKGTNSSAGAKVDILSSTFEHNSAGTRGGAFFNSFYNSDTKEGYAYIADSSFNNNDANLGGAVFVEGWTDAVGNNAKLWIENSEFNNNDALENGGAIYNESVLTINGANFNANHAVYGGAIHNMYADREDAVPGVMNLTDVTFTGNTADELGGAIYSAGVMTFNGAMRFDGNSAGTYGGAIYGDDGYMTFNDAVTFDGNTAAEDGGAVYWYSINGDVEEAQRTLTFKKAATFTNNSGEGGWGGALYTLGSIVKFEDGATFTNNSVFNGGGAIYADWADLSISGTSNFTNNTADEGGAVYNTEWGRVDISGDATFANNTATEHGGAIYNGIYQDDEEDAGLFTIANATFTGNSANQGGAIYNDNLDDATDFVSMEITDATFNGNTATEEGGAIYNLNGMTFAGTNSFTGNTAGGAANDIYNAGTLNFVGGSTTTIDGGITGDGTLNIASGATFNLGTASVTQSDIILDGVLNADLKSADEFAFFDIANEFGGEGTLNLAIYNIGEYNVFRGAEFDNRKINVTVSSVLFDWNWNEDFDTITATMKSTEDIATENGISAEAATTVANLVNSSSDKLNDLANAIQDKLASGDADAAAAVEQAHAAIHPETESVVQSVAMHVQDTVANLAAGRLTALTLGRGGGDVDITAGGVWAQGIYNKSKQNDAFRGYTRGVAGGVDMTMNRVLTLGAGYSYAHSDITGTARDTEIDSSTIFAYGQYKPTDWFVNAMANYTMSDYSEHAFALGTNIDANYDVHSYGGQVMTGYDFAGGITPAVGVRYMHVSADEYKNSLGIKNKLQDSDYMTAVLETRWTYGFKLNRGLMLKPELRYAVKYDFMSDEQVATILLPGVDSYALDGTRLSRLGAEFGGGLGIRAGGLDLSVNYEIEIREGFTSQTGRARIRYEF